MLYTEVMARLGEFQEAVLLAAINLRPHEEHYGAKIIETIERVLDRTVHQGALATTLNRLEARGLITTHLGDPTPERGGRAKRFVTVTRDGRKALEEAKRHREGILLLRTRTT